MTKVTIHGSYVWLKYVFFSIFVILQLWLLTHLQLFGDEAFYWLEGQHLAWSYSELPGWTAWMTRLGTEILGNSYFAVRAFSYLGFSSIFWAIFLINNHLSSIGRDVFTNLMLLLSVPIVTLIAVMALPDVWLLVFVIWLHYFFIKACAEKQKKYWIIIGLLLACSINVHVRMWIWLFIAGLVFILLFRSQIKIIKPLFFISVPIALLGLLPVLIFNFQHEFVLFNFQFGQRHPWQFQLKNLNFLFAQFIVVTPVVLYLWFNNILNINNYKNNKLIINWLLLTSFIHWLLYVFLSLFADGLRTTVHWVVISYVPVLAISTILIKNKKLLLWSISTGSIASLSFLVFLSVNKLEISNIQARILDNSTGWRELAQKVNKIQQQYHVENIITDYFMTAAELAFELDKHDSIKVLPHQKNTKHGRQQQLKIMNMLIQKPQAYREQALLIVEDSTLKLQEKGAYYQQLCHYFNSLKYLQTINISNSKKQFHVFIINQRGEGHTAICNIPPLFYIDHIKQEGGYKISGWVVLHDIGIKSLALISKEKLEHIISHQIENTGIAQQFPEIKDPQLPFNGFEIFISTSQIVNKQFRIQAIANDGKLYLSQIYFLD
ncbi:MAG: glycosyltransferase family 39 protein [Alcanivoracaceae bacterium]|nr:glycosyltransferase family 39 protein [Alcanivoracaceae bacterium]